MWFSDLTWMQGTTLLLACAAAVLSLGSVMLGLYFTLTGKDPLPKRVRRVLRRMPASVEDFRLRGVSLTLGGVAVMLMATILTANAVYMLNIGGFTGYAPVATVEFPKDTVFLVTVLAALAAIACFFGSYLLALRVRYVSTRNSTGAQVGMPPA